MRRCFQLALNGLGNVAPNPLVGAVIVYEGRIIGEGFHAQYGDPHAEVMAVRNCNAPELLSKSTLYVNLEPCSHFGKTPPCADLIVEQKIPHVVICNTDPFPEVAGRGIQKLKNAGVNVLTGVLEQEGEKLNRRFFTFHRKKRPYVILKWAQSSDGFLDGNQPEPMAITSPQTNQIVHQWRTQEAGILVGYHTALKDNPQLTARHFMGKNPTRIVVDSALALPLSLHVFSDGNPTLVLNDEKESTDRAVRYIKTATRDIAILLHTLYELRIQSVIVEGGRKTLQRFIDTGLWDEARILTGAISIGEGTQAPQLVHGNLINSQVLGKDTIHIFERSTTQP